MANTIITMSKIRQILRLHTQGKSKLRISEQTGVARNTVKKYLWSFTEHQLTIEDMDKMSDQDLDELFGKQEEKEPDERFKNLLAFFPRVDKEIRRTGVTLGLMWKEYLRQHPDGYRHSQFGHYYSDWSKKPAPVMHIIHKAGDKVFVDFAGEKMQIVDKDTGELTEAEVFVAILGASQLTYVEATESQKKEDFVGACENALHYFGGVPAAIVSDNLKSAVTKSDRYEPTLNQAFADFAEHYQTYILPARIYKPKDKSLVEGAVKITYQRIYAALRDKTFFSLEELNHAIAQELEVYNNTVLTGKNYSRRQHFEEIEKSALIALPPLRYEFKKLITVTVAKNGHFCLNEDKHYYSVPHQHIGKRVRVVYGKSQVEVFYRYQSLTIHPRVKSPYNYTTNADHLASTHRFLSDWTPEKFINWANGIGPDVKMYIVKILDKKQHPEQAYKSCIGVLSLAKKAGDERLVNACKRALDYGIYNYKIIQTILERGLDQLPDEEKTQQLSMPLHENIRGEEYYQ